MQTASAILHHYESPNLLDRIRQGLETLGKSPGDGTGLTPDDLAPVDEFHLRGPAATEELIALLDPAPEAAVLDLGAGLGGPARRLAAARGCRVTGVDLNPGYVEVGRALNAWTGLSHKVGLQVGDVTCLEGLAPQSFDAAWSFHVGMNVADKTAFYGAAARVLKPGGRFVIYDIMAADGRPEVAYPAPWARTAADSFLATLGETRAALAAAGFAVLQEEDQSTQALGFLDTALARLGQSDGPPPLGLHLVLGPDVPVILKTQRPNLAEGRLRVVALLSRKSL